MGFDRIIFLFTQSLATTIGGIAIDHFGAYIDRLVIFTIRSAMEGVALRGLFS